MWTKCLKMKSENFEKQQLTNVVGDIPDIKGRMYRIGPSILGRNNSAVPHWFFGLGGILEVEFKNKQVYASYKTIQSFRYLQEQKIGKNFSDLPIQELLPFIQKEPNFFNPANTSILLPENNPNFYAICEGGDPFKISKQEFNQLGFDNFGFLTSPFSAHPKVEPGTGEIFNFGTKDTKATIYRISRDLKLLQKNQFTLRWKQFIHDCILAGDYLLVFEPPVHTEPTYTLKQGQPTLIHIFDKTTLKSVDTIEAPPFYLFHFTNGYSNGKKIVIEYIKYEGTQNITSFFQYLKNIPKSVLGVPLELKFESSIEQMTIDLQTRKVQQKSFNNYTIQFPVVSNKVVGKEWVHAYYAAVSGKNVDYIYNSIFRRNRLTNQTQFRCFGEFNHVSQPLLIEETEKKYLILVVYRSDVDKSFVHLIEQDTLSDVCVLELPKVVPAGFHGKWDYN